MKKIIFLVLITILIYSCGNGGNDDQNNIDINNGKWASSCDSSSLINSLTGSVSNKRVMIFDNGKIYNELYLFSDLTCSTLVSKEKNNLLANLMVSYVVGKEIGLVDSVLIREINFVNSTGDKLPDIYTLTNNKSELYFGIKKNILMEKCSYELNTITKSCWSVRPTDINYNEINKKI